jgi:hypothetical protein
MKNILTHRIDHLNFKDGETVRSTRAIRATNYKNTNYKNTSQLVEIVK